MKGEKVERKREEMKVGKKGRRNGTEVEEKTDKEKKGGGGEEIGKMMDRKKGEGERKMKVRKKGGLE